MTNEMQPSGRTKRDRERERLVRKLVVLYASGSVPLSLGAYLTAEKMKRRRKKVLSYDLD